MRRIAYALPPQVPAGLSLNMVVTRLVHFTLRKGPTACGLAPTIEQNLVATKLLVGQERDACGRGVAPLLEERNCVGQEKAALLERVEGAE
jgi:hypothetical protein